MFDLQRWKALVDKKDPVNSLSSTPQRAEHSVKRRNSKTKSDDESAGEGPWLASIVV